MGWRKYTVRIASFASTYANSKGDVTSIKVYDFSTLYTNLPHTELKERIPKFVGESFEGLDKKYISLDRNLQAHWTNTNKQSILLLMPWEITKILHFLLDNVYFQRRDTTCPGDRSGIPNRM